MIELCREGVYGGRTLENFRATRPDWFRRYMRETGPDRYAVVPEIRRRIDYRVHNFFGPLLATAPFDLILLRNVLIYFARPDQEKVLASMKPRLATGGRLIVGESESLSYLQNDFKLVEPFVYASAGEADAVEKGNAA